MHSSEPMQERSLRRRKQTTEISLTSGMSDAVAVRQHLPLRKRGASMSVNPADAGADAGAVGVVQEDFHTSIPVGEDQAASNESLIVELTNDGEIKATETDYDSESYLSDISEDCPVGEEESFSVIQFQSLACLNVNSNGKTSRVATRSTREADTEVKGDVQQRQRDPGQSSMEPVGLTLPRSGVTLRMMVSAEEKQKLLANTKVQVIQDVPKKRGRKAGVKTRDTQTQNLPNRSLRSRSWTDSRDVNVNRYNVPYLIYQHRTDVQAPKAGYFISVEPPEASATPRMSGNQENQRRMSGHEREDVMQIPLYCGRQNASQSAANCDREVPQPPCPKGSSNGKLLYSQGRGMEAQPLLAGPSWRVDNEHIDVSNQETIQTFSFREEVDGCQQVYTHGSAATNPSKQYMAAPLNDHLKRHGDQHSDADHLDKKARNNPQEYQSNSTGHNQQSYRRSARDEKEDTTTRDETFGQSAMPGRTKMMTSQVDRGGRHPPNPDRTMRETDGRTLRQNSDLLLTSSANQEFTSFTPVPSSSSPLDAEKMAQFTEYTENMRRNMRQDYRNLSLLIKSFTEGLQEKNTNQSSQSRSDVNQPDKAPKTNDKAGCLIM
ncbi:hypothetical protein BsWGS_04507 [Bradybaena similaris]